MRSAVAIGVGAALLVACQATGGGTATPAEAAAPGTGAAAPAPGGAQVVRFHLAPSEHGRRVFVPGLALSRTDATGASVQVPIATPAGGDAGSGGDTSAVVPGAGHYRAHFLVARCAPDSPDGTCRTESPKPDDVDFDMPATGDLDVSVR